MDEETKDIFNEISKFGVMGYNCIQPIRKLKALSALIEIVYELSSFKENVSGLLEKQAEMGKKKSEVESQL